MKLRRCFFLLVAVLFNCCVKSSSLVTTAALKLAAAPLAKRTGQAGKTVTDKALAIIPQFNLGNKEFVEQLETGNVPHHLLMNPEFFDQAMQLGHRSLCPRLLRHGQIVNILKENGDNLFVKMIQKGMPELIGMLVERGSHEAVWALKAVDASSGLTPFNAAILHQDRIAVLEIVSPRKSRPDFK